MYKEKLMVRGPGTSLTDTPLEKRFIHPSTGGSNLRQDNVATEGLANLAISNLTGILMALLGGSSHLASGLVTTIYKPFRPFGRAATLLSLLTMVVNHLLTGDDPPSNGFPSRLINSIIKVPISEDPILFVAIFQMAPCAYR